MGYRVEYGPIPKLRGREGLRLRPAALTAGFFLLFLILVQTLWPRGVELLRGILIPGDAEVTVMALDTFALELSQGETLKSAFAHFCMSIVEGAKLASG